MMWPAPLVAATHLVFEQTFQAPTLATLSTEQRILGFLFYLVVPKGSTDLSNICLICSIGA
jgi:hypothetical protein